MLVLDNDIKNRSRLDAIKYNSTIKDVWDELSIPEQKTIEFIINNNGATREDIEKLIDRSRTTAINLLNRLIKKKIIIWTGTTKTDNFGKYIIKS